MHQDIHVQTTKLHNYDQKMKPIKMEAITLRWTTEATHMRNKTLKEYNTAV